MVTDQVGETRLHPVLWGKSALLDHQSRNVKAQEIHGKTHYYHVLKTGVRRKM